MIVSEYVSESSNLETIELYLMANFNLLKWKHGKLSGLSKAFVKFRK